MDLVYGHTPVSLIGPLNPPDEIRVDFKSSTEDMQTISGLSGHFMRAGHLYMDVIALLPGCNEK